MATEAKIWLSVCALILTLAVAGIVLLQRTGRAGKYAWTNKDSKQSAGCLIQLILGIPFIAAIGVATQYFSPVFRSTNFWNNGIWLYLGLCIACGIFNLVVKKLTQIVESRIDSQDKS